MKAIWNDQIIAESNETIVIEGNHYFPKESVNMNFIVNSGTHSTCPWKGKASYFSIKVGENINNDAAWYYPVPKSEAAKIQNYVAFWKGVKIVGE